MSRPRVSPAAPIPSHSGVRVGIVEDDQQLRRTLTSGLTDEGFSVVLAVATGGELLEHWDAAAPALLVLDPLVPIVGLLVPAPSPTSLVALSLGDSRERGCRHERGADEVHDVKTSHCFSRPRPFEV